ncbi:MAG: hypothetical protein JSW64_06490 [Candidatus Zixiibacteriota bacterium]|nr:MAG: hypothetical protein JSW64_06490 [candidate division Zixibacteria bacterium]
MDLFTIIIIIGVLIAVIGGICWYLFIFLVARAVVKGIAKNLDEFMAMDTNGMYRTLVHLQQSGNFRLGQQYMNNLDGPVASEIRGMAASEGISLDF